MSTLSTTEVSSIDILEQNLSMLNTEQRKAVETIEGPVMVVAGPGTGKTQILALRIANLLYNPDLQLNPSNILCLTFTESAVTAMRNRLIKFIGSDAYYVKIFTFHSFCNEVIQENNEIFLGASPLSDLEQIQIANKIIDSLDSDSAIKPFGDPYFYRRDLIYLIQTLKRESISPEDLMQTIEKLESFYSENSLLIESFISKNARSIKEHDINNFFEALRVKNQEAEHEVFVKMIQEFFDQSSKTAEFKKSLKDFYEKGLAQIPKQKELSYVYKSYLKALKEENLYDFEDMILRVIHAFEKHPELLAKYQEQFQYILVDEYQDTNGAQNKILALLTSYFKENPNLFVVGDDDQAIYRFQGASLENIISFYKLYQKHLEIVVLKNNYRSHQNILDIASLSIKNNQARIASLVSNINKELIAAGQKNTLNIELHKCLNYDAEVYWLANRVSELIESGTGARDIAILVRENKEADHIAKVFNKLGINHKLEAKENILDDRLILQLLDLLRVIENPNKHSNLLFNLLNYQFIFDSPDFSNIKHKDIFEINKARKRPKEQQEAKSFFDLLLESEKFGAWANKLLKFNQLSSNLRCDELLEKITREFNFINFSLTKSDYMIKVNNLDSLFVEIRNLIEAKAKQKNFNSNSFVTGLSLKDLLEHLDLIQDSGVQIKARPVELNSNAVAIMTSHKAKGLEYDHVFVISLNDKKWGNKSSRARLKLPVGLISETESLTLNNENEDERRLFFVALTRAKKGLYLSHHMKNTRNQEIVPSIFLSEVQNFTGLEIFDHSNEAYNPIEIYQNDNDDAPSLANETDYINSLLESYKLSVTHLNNFFECPRKFFFQNLLRVPAAKSRHASFGTAVHKALYDLYTRYQSLGQEFIDRQGKEFLYKSFSECLIAENLEKEDEEYCLDFGKTVLDKYFDSYQNKLNSQNLLEYDFSTLGVNFAGIQLTGKLDKVEIHENNNVNIVDYKTGKPDNKGSEMRPGGGYHRQIAFYQLLCDTAKENDLFKYQMRSGEIDFVQADKENKMVKKKISISSEDLNKLTEEIEFFKEKLFAHDFSKTEDLSKCKNCAFKNVCGR